MYARFFGLFIVRNGFYKTVHNDAFFIQSELQFYRHAGLRFAADADKRAVFGKVFEYAFKAGFRFELYSVFRFFGAEKKLRGNAALAAYRPALLRTQ